MSEPHFASDRCSGVCVAEDEEACEALTKRIADRGRNSCPCNEGKACAYHGRDGTVITIATSPTEVGLPGCTSCKRTCWHEVGTIGAQQCARKTGPVCCDCIVKALRRFGRIP